ncbi:MAG: ABC transporter permease subunit, partial [Bacillota bacterium]
KKERMEQVRSGRLTVLIIVFALFGIMNPAIAKLTPWMLQTLSGTLAENGITIGVVEVNALTSWTQFYKNIPMALIIFVLMLSGAFTAEYQKETLVLVLTKGLGRIKVLAAKALTMLALWTLCYFLCYFVTFFYTGFLWDNGTLRHLFYAAFLYYVYGVWVLSLMVLFSALLSSNTGVLLGTGGIALAVYLLGLIPALGEYSPMYLTDSLPLLTSALQASAMVKAIAVTVGLILVNGALAAAAFRRRHI